VAYPPLPGSNDWLQELRSGNIDVHAPVDVAKHCHIQNVKYAV